VAQKGNFYSLEVNMGEPTISRRSFLKGMVVAGIAASSPWLLAPQDQRQKEAEKSQRPSRGIDLAIAQGDDPKGLVYAAIAAIGGMERFVRRGDIVVVKPNIAWNRTPEQAANTNPAVVEAVVELCLNAGAKKVKVFDRTVNQPQITYRRSGIAEAVRRAGGSISYVNERRFKETAIPQGVLLKSWSMYTEALDADVFINVPIAKHHSTSRLTMAMKNIMGILGGDRGDLHPNIDQKLADLNTRIKSDLIILDAYRILTANGPNGGTLRDVKKVGQVIVGTDPVAVDSYGATLFGLRGEDLGFVRIGHQMGLGEMNLDKLNIHKVNL